MGLYDDMVLVFTKLSPTTRLNKERLEKLDYLVIEQN
jgi:hypothetical protein